MARDGGGWAEHVGEVTEAYNARPHQAVTVAPEDVETKPAATFRVLRDNAEKFEHNKNLTLLKQALPVPRGSGEPRGRLTRPPVPLAVRQLRDFNPGPVAPP